MFFEGVLNGELDATPSTSTTMIPYPVDKQRAVPISNDAVNDGGSTLVGRRVGDIVGDVVGVPVETR